MAEEKSVFIEFFGDYPLFRVLDFLIENRYADYSKTEISRGADVSWATLFHLWPKLEETGVVKKTRAFGNTVLFKLDGANPIVQKMMKVELDLIRHYAGEPAAVKARAVTA